MSLAFVFPGQGSQSVGMQAELAAASEVVRATYNEASEVLGDDLWQIVSSGPAERLNQTAVTQPAMLTAGIAAWRLWRQRHAQQTVAALAGHSLGEYTALVAAGSLRFADAVRLVARRGELMQQAAPPGVGAMAAILGLADEAVGEACERVAKIGYCAPANFNAPGQVVIAGEKPAVEAAVAEARALGARRALLLPVSVPSHCRLMQPAAEALREALAATEIAPPEIPVWHNVDARPRQTAEAVREALAAQLHRPVLWTAVVEALAATGVRRYVECGPGRVLSGLVKRILRDAEVSALEAPDDFDRSGLRSAAANERLK